MSNRLVAAGMSIYNVAATWGEQAEEMLAARPRILVFAGAAPGDDAIALPPGWDVVRAATIADGLGFLHSAGTFDGILIPAGDPHLWHRLLALAQQESVLALLGEGVAIVSPDLRIEWANATFEQACDGPVLGKLIHEALGAGALHGPEATPFGIALAGKAASARLAMSGDPVREGRVTPLLDHAGRVQQLIVLCRDVTAEVHKQQKLDALHQAGRELASLTAEQLPEVSAEERVEMLKHNIRRLTHDLLHYDVIEVRLLDPKTCALRPLLAEGMTPEAARRVLYARPEGNGVTGYVAATGKSYVCADTAHDPYYIEGACGAAKLAHRRAELERQGHRYLQRREPARQRVRPAGPAIRRDLLPGAGVGAAHARPALAGKTADRVAIDRGDQSRSRPAGRRDSDREHLAAGALDRPRAGDGGEAARIIANARSIKESIQKVGEDIAPACGPLAFPSSAPPSRLNLRVLVVDNDERVRRSAHSVLGRLGCIVETARDGQEALTMAKLSSYDAMLADIRLPDISGYEVYRALRQAQPAANVILMTGYGYDAQHSLVKARQDGLKHVLYKPFRVDQLLAALQDCKPPLVG